MSEHELQGEIAVTCPDCGTKTVVDADRSGDVVETHNESRHDGENVARVPVRGPDGDTLLLPHPDTVDDFEDLKSEITDDLKA